MIHVHLEGGEVTVRESPVPEPARGQALLRLLRGGICNTDLELLRGYYGFTGTPGHEFVAEVTAAPDPRLLGRIVVGGINLACGKCPSCAQDMGRHCPRRTVLGIVKHPGAFAEFFTLPVQNLHVIPSQVPLEHATFAEPVAAACEILDQVPIPAGSTAAVLGDGKLGLLCAQTLALNGIKVHLFGRHRRKLRVAEALGVEGRMVKKPPRASYRYVVEATGSAAGLEQAVFMTQPRGTVILKSTVHEKVLIGTAPVVVNEITLVGSRCGRLEPALKLLRSGKLNLDAMIDDVLPLREARRAFARAQEKGVLKVLLAA
jgi:alcohol dehydrogenase